MLDKGSNISISISSLFPQLSFLTLITKYSLDVVLSVSLSVLSLSYFNLNSKKTRNILSTRQPKITQLQERENPAYVNVVSHRGFVFILLYFIPCTVTAYFSWRQPDKCSVKLWLPKRRDTQTFLSETFLMIILYLLPHITHYSYNTLLITYYPLLI